MSICFQPFSKTIPGVSARLKPIQGWWLRVGLGEYGIVSLRIHAGVLVEPFVLGGGAP